MTADAAGATAQTTEATPRWGLRAGRRYWVAGMVSYEGTPSDSATKSW